MSDTDINPQTSGWYWTLFAEVPKDWHLLHICEYEGTITFYTPGPWNDMTPVRFRGPVDVAPPEFWNPFTERLEPNETKTPGESTHMKTKARFFLPAYFACLILLLTVLFVRARSETMDVVYASPGGGTTWERIAVPEGATPAEYAGDVAPGAVHPTALAAIQDVLTIRPLDVLDWEDRFDGVPTFGIAVGFRFRDPETLWQDGRVAAKAWLARARGLDGLDVMLAQAVAGDGDVTLDPDAAAVAAAVGTNAPPADLTWSDVAIWTAGALGAVYAGDMAEDGKFDLFGLVGHDKSGGDAPPATPTEPLPADGIRLSGEFGESGSLTRFEVTDEGGANYSVTARGIERRGGTPGVAD